MTPIAFHFNAPSKLAYACRLLRKAVASGSTVAVVGEDSLLVKLDEQLWSFSSLDFIAHGRYEVMSPEQRSPTPIWLCHKAAQGQGRQVLVNLLHTVPDELDAFERVIEVVTNEESDKQSARTRWKLYTERGHEIVRHDLKSAPAL